MLLNKMHLVCFLTTESQQASVGDGGLTQVQNLKAGQMLRQQPQPCVAKLSGGNKKINKKLKY